MLGKKAALKFAANDTNTWREPFFILTPFVFTPVQRTVQEFASLLYTYTFSFELK